MDAGDPWSVVRHDRDTDGDAEKHSAAAIVGARAAQDAAERAERALAAIDERISQAADHLKAVIEDMQAAMHRVREMGDRAEQIGSEAAGNHDEALKQMKKMVDEAKGSHAATRALADGFQGMTKALVAAVEAMGKASRVNKRVVRDSTGKITGIEAEK